MYPVFSHNSSIPYCDFQQQRADKTTVLVKNLISFALDNHFAAQTPQSSHNSPSGRGSCDSRTRTGWGRASNGPAKATRVTSLSIFTLIQPVGTLNHFPLHYKRHLFSFTPTSRSGFNHEDDGEISASMLLIQHIKTHKDRCTFHFCSSQNTHMRETHREKDAHVINTDTECLLLMDPSNSGLWTNTHHSINGDFSICSCGRVCVCFFNYAVLLNSHWLNWYLIFKRFFFKKMHYYKWISCNILESKWK